jgi:hypothetical protein
MKLHSFVFLATFLLLSLSFASPESADCPYQYEDIQFEGTLPKADVFQKAVSGYCRLKEKGGLGQKELLTIINLKLSSTNKRLWVIDLANGKILYHTLVAHGRGSGAEFALSFSNKPQSYQSSLGFYVTGKTYYGKHGLSLYLDGMEPGINDKARERAIVMHGASYVSMDFVKKYGRLGRSHGCPAIPKNKTKEVIEDIAGQTCLFVYYPDKKYLENSKLIKHD